MIRWKQALTVGVLGAGFIGITGCKGEQKEAKATLPSPTSSALPKVEVPRIDQAVPEERKASGDTGFRGTGTLYPVDRAELGPKMTGVITRITVDEGDKVKKNQLLFAVDAGQAALGVQQAQAMLSSAEINLGAAELDFRRTKELFDRGSVPPATFDQVKARYDGAKSQVDQANVALSQARKAASDTAVYAPFSGVVTSAQKSVGELATLMPPTVVLVLEDVSKLELRARLPERALGDLQAGDKLQARFPATGATRELTVARINPTVDPRARTIEVVSKVDNADGKLRPGMLAEVTFDEKKPMATGSAAATAGAAGSVAAGDAP